MAIPVQRIVDRMRQVGLDAEGSDYYSDSIDLIPAINAAVEWTVSVINSAMGAKKVSEEVFRDLTYTRVFQTSEYSRIKLDAASLGHGVWTILAVYPLPTVYPAETISATTNPWDSSYRGDLSHLSSANSAARLTLEEWVDNKSNPFAAGNSIETCADLIDYAYVNPVNYNMTTGVSQYNSAPELEIRPALNKKLVSIAYVKQPTLATVVGDNLEFPESMSNLIYEKALQFVSYKQGDGTNIYAVTGADINTLLQTIL